MQPDIVWKTDEATVLYRGDTKIVHHEFHCAARGELFRNVLLAGLEAMKKGGGAKWLSDDRKNASLLPDDESWARTVWFPGVAAAGWKFWAIVLPERIAAKWNMQRHVTHFASMGIVAKTFGDPDEALAWLEAAGDDNAAD